MLSIFENEKTIYSIPLKFISPNPNQPRKYMDAEQIASLAASIEENGLINPITLRKIKKDSYELICGERRFLAYKHLKRETIPAIIKISDKLSSSALALIENTERQNLNFLEEAIAINDFIAENFVSQSECAKKLGFTQSAIANKLRILRLPPEILKSLAENGFSERHARALLLLEGTSKLEQVCQRVIKNRLTVSQTEKLCQNYKNKKANPPLVVIKDIRVFTSSIDNAVGIMKKAGYNIKTTSMESEDEITVTIVIPKESNRQNAI